MAQLVEHSVHAVCRGFEPRLRQTSLHKGLSPDTEGNMYVYVHVHVCMYVCTPAATDCSEDELDVSLQQLHQSLPLTGLHQIHPLTVGPLVLTKVLMC